MISSEKTNWFVPLFIIIVLTSIFGLFSTGVLTRKNIQERKEFDFGGRPVQPMTMTDQIVLTKNKRVVVGPNGIVFKGIEKSKFYIDLYLLEMDPEQAYRKQFTKKTAKKEMLLGKERYRLILVNDNNLVLKKYSE